ncbi:LuxR C-terminal-related transcriptional regulator [Jiangella alkaliphila]|uniref:Regulatory protein, luxR family n=1 Tax=Jiangella alkaliphila TaxID=419479 RepID=A0A1H2JGI2_9ACTN|nr:LuxR C-terminal-related transcriptional regulator [Jiangella alkaliphila]SDU55520.1 regulatory protein, luxR family [Jiangella alkaliphila]
MNDPTTVGVPRPSRDHLSRPRLLAALGDGELPLRVVRAPAGYGKTALLAEWARSRPATVWITVDDECATRLGFWSRVVALLGTVHPALADVEVSADAVGHLPALLPPLLDAGERPLTLVVDAAERLADPKIEGDLLRLVTHTARLELAVGTRRDGELTDPATALSIDAVTVGPRQLAFTAEEAARLAAQVDSPLTAEQVGALHDASAGWPLAVRAGVRLAHEHPWPAAHEVDTLSRLQWMLVGDLEELPGFADLVLLSVVDGVSVRQAELLGVHLDGHPIVAAVEARGLGGWEDGLGEPRFRLQPLVRDAVRGRLDDDRLRAAHRRLVDWYEDRGDRAGAFESALIAQEWQRARTHLGQAFREVAGGLDRQWLRRVDVPKPVLRAQPLLALFVAVGHYALGDVAKAVRLLTAGVATAEWQRLSRHGRVSVDHVWIQGMLTLGLRFAGRDELVQPALRRLHAMLPRAADPAGELDHLRPIIVTQTASTHLLLDRVDDAVRTLAEPPPSRAAGGSGALHAESLAVLAHASAGRITQARAALAELVDPRLPRFFNAGFYAIPKHIGAAYVHLEDHRPDAADDELAQTLPHWPTVEWWPMVLHARTLQRWHAAGPAEALHLLETGLAEKSRKPLGAAMRAMLTAVRAELLLAAGRPAEARRLIPSRRIRPYPRLAVAKARGLLLDGDHARALAITVAPEHEHRGTPRDRLHLGLIAASARLRSGDPAAAARAFAGAVARSRDTGLRSPFAAMPQADFRTLVAAVPDGAELRADVGRFPALFPEPDALVSLTRRESAVLAELATPDTLPVIAGRLGVAAGTVKSQCRAIYRKLGVSGRDDAVAEARRRGLL